MINQAEASFQDFPEEAPSSLLIWYGQQLKWTRGMIASNGADLFWQSMGLWLHQLEGVVRGYNYAKPNDVPTLELPAAMMWQDAGGHGMSLQYHMLCC
jgi:cellulose synthase/poly-beta-1,6-N-acetylglucosamine synthase-like glycosyltransferase